MLELPQREDSDENGMIAHSIKNNKYVATEEREKQK